MHAAVSRRTAVAALGATLAGAAPSASAQPVPLSPEIPAARLCSGNYWAMKERDGRKIWLALYRRHLGAPQPEEARRRVLFLVHGSSAAALPSFDLFVRPGKNYSLMTAFARYGFDVWTMDHEGYGRSSRTSGNSDIATGVADLRAAADLVARETGQSRFHYLGESSGALRAGAFAMAQPDRVDRLVLEAFVWTGNGSPTLGKRAEQVEYYRTHNRRPRDRDMLLSIFSRDHPGTTDPEVAAAFADAELTNGTSVPSGTYLDMTANLPIVDPARVASPVLIVRGEYDGIAALDDLLAFYAKLPNPDRQFSIIPGAAHSVTLSRNQAAFVHVVQAFLNMPSPPAS